MNQQSMVRLNLVDIIRGVAICGILPVNIIGFSATAYLAFNDAHWPGNANLIVQSLITFFIAGKCYAMLSLLFGISFSLQLSRAANNTNFTANFVRRALGLLLFGLLHAVLIWWGDVLHIYGLESGNTTHY